MASNNSGGKGSNRRPTNQEAYSNGYDRIFGQDKVKHEKTIGIVPGGLLDDSIRAGKAMFEELEPAYRFRIAEGQRALRDSDTATKLEEPKQ